MTMEEEKSVIGGVVVEYDKVKKRLVALEAEGKTISHALTSIATMLQNPLNAHLFPMPEMVEPQKIQTLLEEIKTVSARKTELAKTLKDYGLVID